MMRKSDFSITKMGLHEVLATFVVAGAIVSQALIVPTVAIAVRAQRVASSANVPHNNVWPSVGPPWKPEWPRVPAVVFSANMSGPQNATQLHMDGMYPLVVYGWQHEDNYLRWSHVGNALNEQCSALKASGTSSGSLCMVYRSVASSQPWFDIDASVMNNSTRKRTWFLQNAHTGQPVSDDGFNPDPLLPPRGQTWLWDYRNREVQDHISGAVLDTVMASTAVDGVFWDLVDDTVCGAFQFEPCSEPTASARTPCGLPFPDGDEGKRAYFNGVWSAMREVARRLADRGKLGVFSSANFMSNISWKPTSSPVRFEPGACILPEDTAIRIMSGVPWMRFYERWVDGNATDGRGATALEFNRSQCVWQIENALLESKLGVGTVSHTSVNPPWLVDPGETPALIHVETALAAFLIAAPTDMPSYFGFSFGQRWYDNSNQRISLYDREVGKPLGPPTRLGCCDGDLLPNTIVHDEEGFHDLFNVVMPTPQECSALCCRLDDCAGFQWTSHQRGNAGNCSDGGVCCWIKPTVGRLWHWSFNSTPGSAEASSVSGLKHGTTWRREYEHATVSVRCSTPAGTVTFKSDETRSINYP